MDKEGALLLTLALLGKLDMSVESVGEEPTPPAAPKVITRRE